ncbi:MAG: lysophospholipase [Acidobacteria bacterium]|nr:lysophospholipase [Acidobacteriota bacterium]
MFRPLVESAPAEVEMVTIAYPPGPANTYDDLLPRVREILPRDRPFFLLGWSFSGPLALRIAAARPPLLRGVILASSFARNPIPYLPRWAWRLVRPFLFRVFPAAAQMKALLGGFSTPELRALLSEAHSHVCAEAMACRARAALTVDATEELTACSVPVLYLRASKDEVIPWSCADEICRSLPAVEIADVSGPHIALVTNPLASWERLQAFMERTESHSCHGIHL